MSTIADKLIASIELERRERERRERHVKNIKSLPDSELQRIIEEPDEEEK